MEAIMMLIGVIAFSISFFVSVLHHIHIYQLNYYKDKVQLNWIKKNIKDIVKKDILLIITLPFLIIFFNNIIMPIIASIILIIVAIINRPKAAKKPLVYTSRIKRLIATIGIIIYTIIAVTYLVLDNMQISYIVMFVLNLLVPLIVLFGNLINKPINYAINQYYINDARKIINSMPNLIVIGVTGSYGKTSVKNFLYKFLSTKYNVLITPENYNTTLGVVKTIRSSLKATHDIFVCEMGATKLGDIKEICDLVKPKYGVVTSIGPQHLESFGSIENVVKTKFELIDSLPADGIAFLNYDNDHIANNNVDKEVIKYGVAKGEVKPFDIKGTNKGLEFKIKDSNDNEISFSTKLIGDHNVENIMGAMAVANYFKIEYKDLVSRVRQLESVPHRLELIKRGNNLIIDDAYNSNPNGARSALKALSKFEGIKILVTPGMIELGEKQYESNFEFGVYAADVCDYIVLVGKEQTKPIYEGIISTKYDENKVLVVDDLMEGLNQIDKIDSNNLQKIILLENDLPDNY